MTALKPSEVKAGIRTSEFWLVVAAVVGSIIAAILRSIDPDTAAIIVAVLGGAYSASRGLAKH